jgi:hypothetical protein
VSHAEPAAVREAGEPHDSRKPRLVIEKTAYPRSMKRRMSPVPRFTPA